MSGKNIDARETSWSNINVKNIDYLEKTFGAIDTHPYWIDVLLAFF